MARKTPLDLAVEEWKWPGKTVAARELRSLRAVARAARRLRNTPPQTAERVDAMLSMNDALARLDRAGGGGAGQ